MSGAKHDAIRRDLGVYVLGALTPAERSRVEHHLAQCGACRDEVAALAALPPLLSRLPADESDLQPPPFEPVAARIAAHRRRARLRERLLGAVALVAILASLTAVVVPGLLRDRDALAFSDGSGVIATIEPRAWGMSVQIFADDLPDRPGYTAVAVAGDGHRTQVASWQNTGAAVTVQGACYLSPDEVARVEILAGGDEEVVSVLRPG